MEIIIIALMGLLNLYQWLNYKHKKTHIEKKAQNKVAAYQEVHEHYAKMQTAYVNMQAYLYKLKREVPGEALQYINMIMEKHQELNDTKE